MTLNHDTATEMHSRAYALAGVAKQLIRTIEQSEGIKFQPGPDGDQAFGLVHALALIASDLERRTWQLVEAGPIDAADQAQAREAEA